MMTRVHIPPQDAMSQERFVGLNPAFTFDALTQGASNELALETARLLAKNSPVWGNPLLIYGEIGLGKTHLLHAIGNELLRQNPLTRVHYVHAQDYFSEVILAYQSRRFDAFQRYYHALDALLMDDVDILGVGSKDRTQEEFLNTLNALVRAQKKVVITCRSHPKDINGLDARLLSRLYGGLSVQIESPDLVMRVDVLKSKAMAGGMQLPDELALLMAEKLGPDIRDLEGAINKLGAFVRFYERELSLETLLAALHEQLDLE